MKLPFRTLAPVLLLSVAAFAQAKSSINVTIYSTGGEKNEIGTLTFEESPGGIMIKPDLRDLPPGPHGFHIHANPSCANQGAAAGGHLDPGKTNSHQGPYEHGHAGDLPILYANADGEAHNPLIAPHLELNAIRGHSVIIHASSDNYSNTPPNGGSGPRIACGVIR